MLTISYLQAQVVGGTDEKLAKLYNSGKFENCLVKADGLTYDEATSKNPEPYLYVAMCFYELSKSEDPIIKEDYKDGFKQAVKYVNKFAKKDKEGKMYFDNIDFINKLKKVQFDEVKGFFDEGDYKKATLSAKQYDKINRVQDFSVLYFVGICEMLSNNSSLGAKDIDLAKASLEAEIKEGKYKLDKQFSTLISSGFLKYSEFLVTNKNLKGAAECLSFGMLLIPNDGYLKAQYNMINDKMNSKQDTIPVKAQ